MLLAISIYLTYDFDMRPIPYHSQIDDHTCGPATVQMVLAAYGITVSQEELDRALETPRDLDKGTEPAAIIRVLEQHGLAVVARESGTLAEIEKAISHEHVVIVCYIDIEWQEGHYVLVTDVNDTHVTLCDPNPDHGPHYKISRTDFTDHWRDPCYTKTNRWMAEVSVGKATI